MQHENAFSLTDIHAARNDADEKVILKATLLHPYRIILRWVKLLVALAISQSECHPPAYAHVPATGYPVKGNRVSYALGSIGMTFSAV